MDTSRQAFLALDNLGKSYGARRVLWGVSLTVKPGEVVSVTGRNGSGKSTLLKLVAGLLRPSQGEVTLTPGHADAKPLDAGDRRRSVGYAAPDLALYDELTGRENLVFFAHVRGRRVTDVERRLADVGLAGRGNDLVRAYSSGMRQRLRLAFALLADPAVLLLDEPSLALDETGVALVARTVARHKAAGGVMLLATNDAGEAALGDRALVLGG